MMDDSSLRVDSQPKFIGLIWGLVALTESLHSSDEMGEFLQWQQSRQQHHKH